MNKILKKFLNQYKLNFSILLLFFISCSKEKNKLYEIVPSDYSGIQFRNDITPENDHSIFNDAQFQSGGGVAVGDIDNDGLKDIFFTSNQSENKLYKNLGNLKFEDITNKAGIKQTKGWGNGVTFEDVNSDGFLDIYICYGGSSSRKYAGNELYINNKNNTFTELAKEYGLDFKGHSIQSAFFDYDKDGDLDMFLLNNAEFKMDKRFLFTSKFERNIVRKQYDQDGGDILYENIGNKFIDVTQKSGIYNSLIGFGLGVTISDFNNDGWSDIFVTNDFFEQDYFYINQKDGTFKDELSNYIPLISLNSMGVDVGDINNDGFSEILVSDMLPLKNSIFKVQNTFLNYNHQKYLNKINGFHYQISKNTLQLSEGNYIYKEVANSFNIAATDWSWASYIFDMDNDGFKDIFISNGLMKNIVNLDFLNFLNDLLSNKINQKYSISELYNKMNERKMKNFFFKNINGENFKDLSKEWSNENESFSNACAYADLDNDGDQDLIITELNNKSYVLKNNSNILYPDNKFLNVKIKGKQGNLRGIGSIVLLYKEDKIYINSINPTKGFQSSLSNELIFGLGKIEILDSVLIVFPDNTFIKKYNIKTDQTLEIIQDSNNKLASYLPIFNPIFKEFKLDTIISHKEDDYEDFDYEILLPKKQSISGPAFAKADVNNDGMDDFFIGGSKGYPAKLFIQQKDEKFVLTRQTDFEKYEMCEDVSAEFSDIDNDGDIDLYVVSGGNESGKVSDYYLDRLYLNNGKGEFIKINLPNEINTTATDVIIFDINKDGLKDIITVSNFEPLEYGNPMQGLILLQTPLLKFENVSSRYLLNTYDLAIANVIEKVDLNKDGWDDFVLGTEFGNIKIFENQTGKKFIEKTKAYGLDKYLGWWSAVNFTDLDGDGDKDLIAGNWGTNSRFITDSINPLEMLVNDFDLNGTNEQIISFKFEDGFFPYIGREDLLSRLPFLKKKFPNFESFSKATLKDMFTEKQINESKKYTVNTLKTMFFENKDGKFIPKNIPEEVQYSPVYAIYTDDVNNDNKIDIILGGNFKGLTPEFGNIESNYGTLLINKGDFNFEYVKNSKSGFNVKGETKHITKIKTKNKDLFLFIRNNMPVAGYNFNQINN